LVSVEPPHHRLPPPLITSAPVNHASQTTSTDFRNKIGQKETSPFCTLTDWRSIV